MSLPTTYKTLRTQTGGQEPKLEQLPLPKPGKNEVLIKMAFAPLSIADLSTYSGILVPPPSPVGMEGSGTIVALGEDLKTTTHSIGDKVHVVAIDPDGTYRFGTYGEYIVVPSECCVKIKGGLSLEEASCPFANPSTVYGMGNVVERGGHKAVIQSAASSAVGRMFIRLMKLKGIKTINIVRKDEYFEELKKEGADYVLNSEAPDFEAQLKELAEKEKATISFDAIAGDFPGTLLKNQPPKSICYVYGFLSGKIAIGNILFPDLIAGKRVAGFALTDYMLERSEKGEYQEYLQEIVDLLPTAFKTRILKVFKFEELKEAIAYYDENSNKGKILLSFD